MLSDVVKNRRTLFLSMGRTKEEICKPLVGVVNSQNELVLGHIHLDEIETRGDQTLHNLHNVIFEVMSTVQL